MISRIHVNQHVLRANRAGGEPAPPLTVKRGGKTIVAWRVEILGPSTVVYSPAKPLSCGATVWVETTARVLVDTAPEEATA